MNGRVVEITLKIIPFSDERKGFWKWRGLTVCLLTSCKVMSYPLSNYVIPPLAPIFSIFIEMTEMIDGL